MPLTTGVSMKASGTRDGLGVPGIYGGSAAWCRNSGFGTGPCDQARERRPEPGTVVPPAHGVDPVEVRRVLVRHVDMGEPEIAVFGVAGVCPSSRWDPGRRLWRRRHEGLVLDDQRDSVAVDAAAVIRDDSRR